MAHGLLFYFKLTGCFDASLERMLRYDARFHEQLPPSADANFDYVVGHSIENLADDVRTQNSTTS